MVASMKKKNKPYKSTLRRRNRNEEGEVAHNPLSCLTHEILNSSKYEEENTSQNTKIRKIGWTYKTVDKK